MIATAGQTGYWPSPWPGEDGGPRRGQITDARLDVAAGGRLTVTSRDALASTMLVLRDPGELFLLRHSLGTRPLEDRSEAWVERLDPLTLEPIARSPQLRGGPFWPGGLAAHANGSLHVVHGRWCHRLSAALELICSRELPRPRPYNSFVVMPDGALITKDIDRTCESRSTLSVLDPESLEPLCAELELPEPAVARLSADGPTLYVAGTDTLMRFRWDAEQRALERDRDWALGYRGRDQGHAWDVSLSGGHAWFMDNGEHTYSTTMLGAGVSPGPVHLIRVALDDVEDHDRVEVCGAPFGAVTNPPLYDAERRIAVGYDSAAGVLAAWRFEDGRLAPLWSRPLATAGHLLAFGPSGELIAYDYDAPRALRRPPARWLERPAGRLIAGSRTRRMLTRRCREDVVVLDIETGADRARAGIPTLFQSALFPCPGWDRDLYYCSFSTVARVAAG